jgi:hypothetical protein
MAIAKPPLSDVWAKDAPAGPTGIEDPGALKSSGWTGASHCPPFSWMNWILNKCDAGVRYLLGHGLPDYDETENYAINDIAAYVGDGKTYRALQANGPATAIKHPSDAAYWERWGHGATEFNTTADARVGLALALTPLTTQVVSDAGSVSGQYLHKLGAVKEIGFMVNVREPVLGATVTLTGSAYLASVLSIQTCVSNTFGLNPNAKLEVKQIAGSGTATNLVFTFTNLATGQDAYAWITVKGT